MCMCAQLALVWVTVTGCATLAHIKLHGAPPPPRPRSRPSRGLELWIREEISTLDPTLFIPPPKKSNYGSLWGACSNYFYFTSFSFCLPEFLPRFYFLPPSLPASVHHPGAETVKSDVFLHPPAFSSSSTPEECGTISSFLASVLTPYIHPLICSLYVKHTKAKSKSTCVCEGLPKWIFSLCVHTFHIGEFDKIFHPQDTSTNTPTSISDHLRRDMPDTREEPLAAW